MPTPAAKAKRGGKNAAPWDCLPADVLQHMAELLGRDRYKLNLVCRAWRDALADARQLWEEISIDPRKKASTSRRIRFNKYLPTPEALGAWSARYGRHCHRLHLRHLDAASEQEGCVGEAGVAGLLRAVAGSLQQLNIRQCRVQALLAHHAAELCSLRHLTSLHFHLSPEEPGLSLGAPEAAFITRLSRLEDLALATGFVEPAHRLPASLAALPALRSLQLARLGGERGARRGPIHAYELEVASCLTGLSSLQRLAVTDFLLVDEDPPADEGPQDPLPLRIPTALFGLPGLTSLMLSDVGLGLKEPLVPHASLANRGLYPVPPELRQLAGSLRELALLLHTCRPEELDVVSALTGLTALALTAKFRTRPSPVPESLSCLTGLAQLKLSHGLTQVPPCITGLTGLTLLDLSYNTLHSLKPGPYLKRLVAVNLRANAFTHFPHQLKVARHTAQELHLPQNDSMEITERDLDQLLTFEQLRQLTIYGASEEKGTRRCLMALQKAMPWLMIDV